MSNGQQKKRGRPFNTQAMELACQLKNQGKSYREIAQLMGKKDTKGIYNWLERGKELGLWTSEKTVVKIGT